MGEPARMRFGDYELDLGAFELRRAGQVCAVEPQVFELIGYLASNAGRLVTKDELIEKVWGGRVVSDAALASRLKSARKAIGDDGERQHLIRTVHGRGVKFMAEALIADGSGSPSVDRRSALSPDIRFCTASDGVRLAYAPVGEGPVLVKTANWLNHLEFDWESPVWRHLLHALAREFRLIRYDERGNGLSDRDVEDLSFEGFVRDLEAVADAAGVERFALLGVSQGCPVAAAYAARHPERVSHLVLYGGYARGWRHWADEAEAARRTAMDALILNGWGQDNPAFRQLFTTRFIPDATLEQMHWFNELQRISATPEVAYRLRQTFSRIDVSKELPKIKAPTLVMHCREDGALPFDCSRELAAGIAGSRFVLLEGRNHLVLENEPAFQRFMKEIRTFLAAPGA